MADEQEMPEQGSPQQPQSIGDRWQGWIGNPNNRAALMQFGMAMLQPLGYGETSMSHFANAVGAAGGASGRVTEAEQQARKSETEAQLRESRAMAAEAAANAAANRQFLGERNLELRAQGLEQQRTNQEQARQISLLGAETRNRRAYDQYQKEVANQNLIAEKGKEQTPLSYDDWKATMGVTAPAAAPAASAIASDPRIATIRQWAQSKDPQLRAQAKAFADQVRKQEPNIDKILGL